MASRSSKTQSSRSSKSKYYKIAVMCIGKEMQKLAVDANLFASGLADGEHFRRYHERYVELAEALKYFENPDSLKGLPLFNK